MSANNLSLEDALALAVKTMKDLVEVWDCSCPFNAQHECDKPKVLDALALMEGALRANEQEVGIRPEVKWFAGLMEARLREKDAERGGNSWQDGTVTPSDLLYEAEQKIKRALFNRSNKQFGTPSAGVRFAVDATNYAMMGADLIRREQDGE